MKMAFFDFDDEFRHGGGGGGGGGMQTFFSAPNDDDKSKNRSRSNAGNTRNDTDITRSAIRDLQKNSLIVSRYYQLWHLLAEQKYDGSRVIRTYTTITFSVTEKGANYGRVFKSIALAESTISDMQVSKLNTFDENNYVLEQSSNTTTLDHTLSVRNGYHFVEVEFDKPLVLGEDVTIQILYHMSGGNIIDGCQVKDACPYPTSNRIDNLGCISPDNWDDNEKTPSKIIEEDKISYCKEDFYAPWANQWKIPVHNITYRFTLPDENVLDYFMVDTLSDKEREWKASSCIIPPYESETTHHFNCTELDEANSKVVPAFRWYLNDRLGTVDHCSSKCGASATVVTIVAAAVGGVIALVFVILLLRCYNRIVRTRRTEQDQQAARIVGVSTQFSEERPSNHATQSSTYSCMNAKVLQFPALAFGASDLQVADALQQYKKYDLSAPDTFGLPAQDKSGKYNFDHDIGVSGDDNIPAHFQKQQVAFSACESCSICITDFTIGERLRLLPRCGHAFHHECVRKWLVDQESLFCPLCQTSVYD